MSYHLQFSPELEEHLAKMQAEASEVQEQTENPSAHHRSLDPEAAAFLSLLVRVAGAKRILEIGTSVGFSTIYIADAVRQTGGHITTVELIPERSERARQNLQLTGLSEYVAIRTGDVREFVGQLTGPWDLLFIDLDKEMYLPIFDMFSEQVRIGGLIVADNVVSHSEELVPYLNAVRADRRYETITIPVGQGIELSRRLR
jgi:predicted O-methyltransferase YrrM